MRARDIQRPDILGREMRQPHRRALPPGWAVHGPAHGAAADRPPEFAPIGRHYGRDRRATLPERAPSGWWLLPFALGGLLLWVVIIRWVIGLF